MNNRIHRVNQLIKKELSQILLKEVDWEVGGWRPKDVLVTVTRVETTPNLRLAKVYVSVMPENQIDKILTILNRQIYELQQEINKRLKMRPVPKIKFLEEKRTSEAGRIEKLLEEIKN